VPQHDVAESERSRLGYSGRVRRLLDGIWRPALRSRHTPGSKRSLTGDVAAGLAILGIASLIALGAPFNALQAPTPDSRLMTLPDDVGPTIVEATSQGNFALLDELAKTADALRKYDVEARLLEEALIIRGNVSGQMSLDYGVGFRKLGDYWREQNDLSYASGFYEKALPLLGDGPEAATALIHKGILEVASQDYAQAAADLSKASSLDTTKSAQANLWLAISAQRQGKLPDAESFYRSSLAMQDPNSPAAATGMELLSALLRQQHRLKEATSFQDQALAARKSQPPRAVAVVSGTGGSGPTPNLMKLDDSVKPPAVISRLEPVYTQEARLANYRETVVVSYEVWPDGLAHRIRIVRGAGFGLSEKAAEAISQWKFRAATMNGQPVAVSQAVSFNFRQ
jgi:TonB family protein